MTGDKLHFDLGALTESPKDTDPVVACFQPGCVWRGKPSAKRQTCDHTECPVRAYHLQQVGDAGELTVYAAAQRFMEEYPPIIQGFSVVVEKGTIKVWYAKGRSDTVPALPKTFEGFPVSCEEIRGF
jgi:hypothetical protein